MSEGSESKTEAYKFYLGKYVTIVKRTSNPSKPYFYNGILTDITEFHLIVDDKEVGKIAISLEDIKEIFPMKGSEDRR